MRRCGKEDCGGSYVYAIGRVLLAVSTQSGVERVTGGVLASGGNMGKPGKGPLPA